MVYHLCFTCAVNCTDGGYLLSPSGSAVKRKCELCRKVRWCCRYEIVSLRRIHRAEARVG